MAVTKRNVRTSGVYLQDALTRATGGADATADVALGDMAKRHRQMTVPADANPTFPSGTYTVPAGIPDLGSVNDSAAGNGRKAITSAEADILRSAPNACFVGRPATGGAAVDKIKLMTPTEAVEALPDATAAAAGKMTAVQAEKLASIGPDDEWRVYSILIANNITAASGLTQNTLFFAQGLQSFSRASINALGLAKFKLRFYASNASASRYGLVHLSPDNGANWYWPDGTLAATADTAGVVTHASGAQAKMAASNPINIANQRGYNSSSTVSAPNDQEYDLDTSLRVRDLIVRPVFYDTAATPANFTVIRAELLVKGSFITVGSETAGAPAATADDLRRLDGTTAVTMTLRDLRGVLNRNAWRNPEKPVSPRPRIVTGMTGIRRCRRFDVTSATQMGANALVRSNPGSSPTDNAAHWEAFLQAQAEGDVVAYFPPSTSDTPETNAYVWMRPMLMNRLTAAGVPQRGRIIIEGDDGLQYQTRIINAYTNTNTSVAFPRRVFNFGGLTWSNYGKKTAAAGVTPHTIYAIEATEAGQAWVVCRDAAAFANASVGDQVYVISASKYTFSLADAWVYGQYNYVVGKKGTNILLLEWPIDYQMVVDTTNKGPWSPDGYPAIILTKEVVTGSADNYHQTIGYAVTSRGAIVRNLWLESKTGNVMQVSMPIEATFADDVCVAHSGAIYGNGLTRSLIENCDFTYAAPNNSGDGFVGDSMFPMEMAIVGVHNVIRRCTFRPGSTCQTNKNYPAFAFQENSSWNRIEDCEHLDGKDAVDDNSDAAGHRWAPGENSEGIVSGNIPNDTIIYDTGIANSVIGLHFEYTSSATNGSVFSTVYQAQTMPSEYWSLKDSVYDGITVVNKGTGRPGNLCNYISGNPGIDKTYRNIRVFHSNSGNMGLTLPSGASGNVFTNIQLPSYSITVSAGANNNIFSRIKSLGTASFADAGTGTVAIEMGDAPTWDAGV